MEPGWGGGGPCWHLSSMSEGPLQLALIHAWVPPALCVAPQQGRGGGGWGSDQLQGAERTFTQGCICAA